MIINVDVQAKPYESIDALLARFRKAVKKSGIAQRVQDKQHHMSKRDARHLKWSRAATKRAKVKKKDAQVEAKARAREPVTSL